MPPPVAADPAEEAAPLQSRAFHARDPPTLGFINDRGNLRTLEEIEADDPLALAHYRGQMSQVARKLGIGHSTLYRKMKDGGIGEDLIGDAGSSEIADGRRRIVLGRRSVHARQSRQRAGDVRVGVGARTAHECRQSEAEPARRRVSLARVSAGAIAEVAAATVASAFAEDFRGAPSRPIRQRNSARSPQAR